MARPPPHPPPRQPPQLPAQPPPRQPAPPPPPPSPSPWLPERPNDIHIRDPVRSPPSRVSGWGGRGFRLWGASPPPHSRRRRRRQCPVGAASARARGGILPPQPGCVLPSGRLHGSSSSTSRNASRQLGAAPRSRAPRSRRRRGPPVSPPRPAPLRRCAACPRPCRSRAGVPTARKPPPLDMRAATVNSPGNPPPAGPPPGTPPHGSHSNPNAETASSAPFLMVALAALPFLPL